MARYRIGETPETGADYLTENLLFGAVVFGLVLGIGFFIVGIRAKQIWLAAWGGGLAICSMIYIGWKLFY